jgi:hypothetical protein
MARVIGVHGAFHELWGPHQIAGRWVPALRDGLALAGADVDPADVATPFYGDVFRPDPATPVDRDELRVIAERTGIVDAAGQLVGGLEALVAQLGQEQVDRTIAQLGRYFDDDSVRDAVRGRVAAAIGADARVVVAHSLGSVVAYEVLVESPGPARLDLVTIGSPLGHHAVIGADLRPALVDGVGAWPACGRRWTNITAVNDPVAGGRPLAPVFPGVVELAVDNGHRAHEPEPYLCSLACCRAVAEGLS